MNKRLLQTSPYEKKIQELQGLVQAEAKRLQNIVDEEEYHKGQIRELAEKKSALNLTIGRMEKSSKEKEEYLSELIQKKYSVIESTKRELNKEKESLKETSKSLAQLSEKMEAILPVVKELQEFIVKESGVQARYVEERKKLGTLEKKHKKISEETEKEKQELQEREESYNTMKTYTTNLYGKLATYVKVAEETLKYVNKELEERNVPIQFGLPGEVLQIDLNNFQEYAR